MIQSREFTFTSTTGQELDARMWLPEGKPRAAVQIVHGMAEHIDRYEEAARFLAEHGFLVVGHTHLGHGPLGRPRGYFGAENGWQALEDDVQELRELTQAEFPGVPYFLLGHSMGSFIARCYLRDHAEGLAGCVLSGTGYFTRAQAKMGLLAANLVCKFGGARKPSHLINKLAFGGMNRPFHPARSEFDWLSRDSYVVDRYLVDPYCGFPFTGAGYRDLFTGLERLSNTAELERVPKTLPVLFLSGDHDPVGDMALGVEKAAEELCVVGLNDVTILLYPNARHEILNEINRREVYDDLLEWLDARLAGEKGRPAGYRPEKGSLARKRKAVKRKRAADDSAEGDSAEAKSVEMKPAKGDSRVEKPAVVKSAEDGSEEDPLS